MNHTTTHPQTTIVMDVLPWPGGYGFNGADAWWQHTLSQSERERLDDLLGLALLDNTVCEQLVVKRDTSLLRSFKLLRRHSAAGLSVSRPVPSKNSPRPSLPPVLITIRPITIRRRPKLPTHASHGAPYPPQGTSIHQFFDAVFPITIEGTASKNPLQTVSGLFSPRVYLLDKK